MGYIDMCGPKGYGFFSTVLVINRVWFLYSSLDMGMFLWALLKRKSTKAPHNYFYGMVVTKELIITLP